MNQKNNNNNNVADFSLRKIVAICLNGSLLKTF